MRFFFYGTLLDRDVASLVLGRRLPPQAYEQAVLPGHERRRVRGASYPIVVRAPKSRVAGAVVKGLSGRDVARLAAYEGPRYRVAPLKVKIRGEISLVSVFAPLEERFEPTGGRWELLSWQRHQKRAFLRRMAPTLSALLVSPMRKPE